MAKSENSPQYQKVIVHCSDGESTELSLFPLRNASKTTPIVLVVPALGIPARKYVAYCEALNRNGVHAACFDLRGLGGSSVRPSRRDNFFYATVVEQEFPAVLARINKEFGQAPVFFSGHSLGGQLSALFLAQAATNQMITPPKGISLVASCSIHYKNWPFPSSWGILAFTQFSTLLANAIGYFPGKSVGFGGTEARGLISDWAYCARVGRYDIKSIAAPRGKRIAFDPLLAKVNVPVLSINFTEDTFAPLKATRNLVEKLDSSDWQRVLIDKDSLGAKTADHYSWMRVPGLPAQKVADWALSITD